MYDRYLLSALFIFLSLWLVAQCPRQQALDNYRNKYLTSNFTNAELNWTGNLSNCEAGTMSDNVRLKHLQRINYYRELVGGLSTNITFSEEKNQKAAETVLMFEAKNTPLPQLIEINHCTGVNGAPCDTWPCNSSGAIEAASKGNIAFSFPNWNQAQPIHLYMIEEGDFNRDVAHRRWILYSRAKEMGIATSPRFNTMWVIGDFTDTATYDRFIAFPPEGYMPQPLLSDKWSFGIPNADFSDATVTMQGPNGGNVPLKIISNNQNFYGDNSIVWEPDGVILDREEDLTYSITISNIRSAAQSSYTYQTIIMPIVDQPEETVTANFNFDINNQMVTFRDASTNATNWAWDFGDGTTTSDRHPTHTFDAGTYTICLTTEGTCGKDTHCQQLQITPTAIFLAAGGTITTLNNHPVPDVILAINTTTIMTDANGQYTSNLLSESTYTITPTKNDNPLIGVSIADAIPIQRHILGIRMIPTPYQQLAADVNGSGTITAFDIVSLRRLILGVVEVFPNEVPVWRFVPSDFIFPNPMNPFQTPIPNQHTFSLPQPRADLNFIAIKTGDVNLSALGAAAPTAVRGTGIPLRMEH